MAGIVRPKYKYLRVGVEKWAFFCSSQHFITPRRHARPLSPRNRVTFKMMGILYISWSGFGDTRWKPRCEWQDAFWARKLPHCIFAGFLSASRESLSRTRSHKGHIFKRSCHRTLLSIRFSKWTIKTSARLLQFLQGIEVQPSLSARNRRGSRVKRNWRNVNLRTYNRTRFATFDIEVDEGGKGRRMIH